MALAARRCRPLRPVESQMPELHASSLLRAGEHSGLGRKGTVGELPGGPLHGAKRAVDADQSRASGVPSTGPHLVAALLDDLRPEPLFARCHSLEFSESLSGGSNKRWDKRAEGRKSDQGGDTATS